MKGESSKKALERLIAVNCAIELAKLGRLDSSEIKAALNPDFRKLQTTTNVYPIRPEVEIKKKAS